MSDYLPPVLPADPGELLAEWLPANDDPDRPQITLSTVTADGGADARTVLMTEFDGDGFYFHTDSRSRKVADIAANPAVALTILWPNFTRQLVVRGTASVAGRDEQAAAYRRRSPYLKQLAWLNSHDYAQLPREVRRDRWAEFAASHPEGLEPPSTWLGFLVRPFRLTFWGSDAEAASIRAEYTLVDGRWLLEYLPG